MQLHIGMGTCTYVAHTHLFFIFGFVALEPQVRSTVLNYKMWASKRFLGLGELC